MPKNSIGNYLCTKVTPRFHIESTGILHNSAYLGLENRSFLNQILFDLRMEKCGFLNQDFPV